MRDELWLYSFCIMCRVIRTRLVSAAGTGYFYTIKKPRLRPRMSLMKYDPVGRLIHLSMENWKPNALRSKRVKEILNIVSKLIYLSPRGLLYLLPVKFYAFDRQNMLNVGIFQFTMPPV